MNNEQAMVRYDYSGRVVLVTGGGSGIGLGICRAFAESQATVICVDLHQPESAGLPDELVFYQCDVSDREQCSATVTKIVERFGRIDTLINNAGIQPADSYFPIDELADDVFDRMVGINLRGYHLMARYVIPQMKAQQSGVICNIASGQAHRTARQVGVYGPIKAANIMQAKQWAVEYARMGIRVVSVSPGAIDTPMVRASLDAQGGGEALANRHPIGRIGRVDEVANAVLWLCSDAASFVTGADLEVDGGLGAFGAFADPF